MQQPGSPLRLVHRRDAVLTELLDRARVGTIDVAHRNVVLHEKLSCNS
jgi:hypothetical protein